MSFVNDIAKNVIHTAVAIAAIAGAVLPAAVVQAEPTEPTTADVNRHAKIIADFQANKPRVSLKQCLQSEVSVLIAQQQGFVPADIALNKLTQNGFEKNPGNIYQSFSLCGENLTLQQLEDVSAVKQAVLNVSRAGREIENGGSGIVQDNCAANVSDINVIYRQQPPEWQQITKAMFQPVLQQAKQCTGVKTMFSEPDRSSISGKFAPGKISPSFS